MFSELYVIKSKSEWSDKSDHKQFIGTKSVLMVLGFIFLIFLLFLPFRFYHGKKHVDTALSFFGTWYRHAASQKTENNEEHVYIDPNKKGYIRLDLEPTSQMRAVSKLPEIMRDSADKHIENTSAQSDMAACSHTDSSENGCPGSRHRSKRSALKSALNSVKKKKEGAYTEKMYYRDAYDAYVKCLEEKTEKYYANLANQPNVVLGEEETTITLKCNMCLRPDHDYGEYKYHWERWLKQNPNQTWEEVQEAEDHYEVDPVSGDLLLNNMLAEDSGRYVCYVRNTEFQAVHYLDILGIERTRQVFDASVTPPNEVKKLEQMEMEDKQNKTEGSEKQMVKLTVAALPVKLEEQNLHVFTKWSEWTKCSRCNVRGERSRHGQCTVQLLDSKKDTDYEILKRFPEGVPCRSSLLSNKLANVKEVKERYSENELGYCLVDCPKEPKKILDENGNPVKVFRNPLKMIKRPKWLPKLPKLVVRRVFYVVVGKKTALKCPNTHKGQAVRWSNGSQVYDRVALAQQKHHRVSIDTSSRLLIHHLQETDTATYTCFVYGKLQGSIKLKAVLPYKDEGVSDWITTGGLVGTVLLILYMGVMLCQQERKHGNLMR